MIEPPRQFFRSGVFEIDDGILVGVKHREVKQVAGSVQKSGVIDFGFGMDTFFVEARKSRCGSDPVEAVTVIQEAKFHLMAKEQILATISMAQSDDKLVADIQMTLIKSICINKR